MIAKSRFTASSSKPVPEPTVKTEFETVGADAAAAEEETSAEARALGDLVEAADTDAAAAEEETSVGARALGDLVEAADTDAAATEEETCAEARALGVPVEEVETDAAAATAAVGCDGIPFGARMRSSCSRCQSQRDIVEAETVEAVDTEAAAEDETWGEARAR